ncbi:MAG: S-layer homology domain-containing protein [Cellulosilyticaceae bacterium]
MIGELGLERQNQIKFVRMMHKEIGLSKQQEQETFSDIHNNGAADVIYRMSKMGIFLGYEDGSFRPKSAITRAEFAVVIARAFGLGGCSVKPNLLDIAPDAWYADAVQNLYARGIVKGRPDGSFGANKPITLEEISVILWRVLSQLGIQVVPRRPYGVFKDEKYVSLYAKEAVKVIYEGDLLQLKKREYLGPKEPVTREQVAMLLDHIFTI